MVPWKKQYVWFWFAAIMVVCGAACFLNSDPTVRAVRKQPQAAGSEIKVARSLEKLSELNEQFAQSEQRAQKSLAEEQAHAESQFLKSTVENERTASQFHHANQPENVEQNLQRASYSDSELPRATLLAPQGLDVERQRTLFPIEPRVNSQQAAFRTEATSQTEIVRVSVVEEQPKRETKPLVWFAGSIEKLGE